jgi:hypothetical protein
MSLEVRKAIQRPVSLILVMPTQPAESLQECASVTAFEEEKVNAKVYAHIDGGSPYQEISLIRGLTALGDVKSGVRGDAEAVGHKDWSQPLYQPLRGSHGVDDDRSFGARTTLQEKGK